MNRVRSVEALPADEVPHRPPTELPTSFRDIVEEIVRFTRIPREEVEHRVWMQSARTRIQCSRGRRPFRRDTPRNNDHMMRLYRDGNGFIFETMVFLGQADPQSLVSRSDGANQEVCGSDGPLKRTDRGPYPRRWCGERLTVVCAARVPRALF